MGKVSQFVQVVQEFVGLDSPSKSESLRASTNARWETLNASSVPPEPRPAKSLPRRANPNPPKPAGSAYREPKLHSLREIPLSTSSLGPPLPALPDNLFQSSGSNEKRKSKADVHAEPAAKVLKDDTGTVKESSPCGETEQEKERAATAIKALEAKIESLSFKNDILQKSKEEVVRENDLLRTQSQLSSFSDNIVDVADGIRKARLGVETACINMSMELPQAIGQTTVPLALTPLKILAVPSEDILAIQNAAAESRVALDIFAEKIIMHSWNTWLLRMWKPFCPATFSMSFNNPEPRNVRPIRLNSTDDALSSIYTSWVTTESRGLSGQLRTKVASHQWKLLCGDRSSDQGMDELAHIIADNFSRGAILPLLVAITRWSKQDVSRLPAAFEKAIYDSFRAVLKLKIVTMTQCVSFDYAIIIDSADLAKAAKKGLFLEAPGLKRWPRVQNDVRSGWFSETETVYGDFSSIS